jgi:biopolymer transport protein TolR
VTLLANEAVEGGELSQQADINVTPLVDVMLVLLIIFMVTAPMLSAGLKVELPQAIAARPADTIRPIVITVTATGIVRIGSTEVSRERLVEMVRKQMTEENTVVHIRGDKLTAYGDVVSVLDELAVNGITRVSLIARRSLPGG